MDADAADKASIYTGLAIVVGFAVPARGFMRDVAGAFVRWRIASRLAAEVTMFGRDGDNYSRAHHNGEPPSSTVGEEEASSNPAREEVAVAGSGAGSSASAAASRAGRVVAAAMGVPLAEAAAVQAAAAAAASSAATAAAAAGDFVSAADAAAAAAHAATAAAAAAASLSGGSTPHSARLLRQRELRLQGPVLHASLDKGVLDSARSCGGRGCCDAPAWERFQLRRAAVHSVDTGTVRGDGTLTLVRPDGGAAQQLHLRQYWVRRVNRVGAPRCLTVVLSLLFCAVVTAMHFAVLAMKQQIFDTGERQTRPQTAALAVLCALPVIVMFWLLLQASLVPEDAPFNGDVGIACAPIAYYGTCRACCCDCCCGIGCIPFMLLAWCLHRGSDADAFDDDRVRSSGASAASVTRRREAAAAAGGSTEPGAAATAVPVPQEADDETELGKRLSHSADAISTISPRAGRGLDSTVFWRNFMVWTLLYVSAIMLTVLNDSSSYIAHACLSADVANASIANHGSTSIVLEKLSCSWCDSSDGGNSSSSLQCGYYRFIGVDLPHFKLGLPEDTRWMAVKPFIILGCFAALHLLAHIAMLASVRSGGTALALIPRPGTPASAVAALALPRGARWRLDGAAVLADQTIMPAPPGTHVLLLRDADEAARWERALAYESCNGVLGVSVRLLEALGSLATAELDNSSAKRDGRLDSTSQLNELVTKPACVAAAKELAVHRGGLSRADVVASPDTHLKFQGSFYEMFLLRRGSQRLLGEDATEAALLNNVCPLPGVASGEFDDDIGPATSFLSHVWSSPFQGLVDALKAQDEQTQERDAFVALSTMAFDADFRATGWLEEGSLLTERQRRVWFDVVFKSQATAGLNLDPQQEARNQELSKLIAAPGGFRWDDKQKDYPREVVTPEEQRKQEEYSAATKREFKFCVSSIGVVDGVINAMVEEPPRRPLSPPTSSTRKRASALDSCAASGTTASSASAESSPAAASTAVEADSVLETGDAVDPSTPHKSAAPVAVAAGINVLLQRRQRPAVESVSGSSQSVAVAASMAAPWAAKASAPTISANATVPPCCTTAEGYGVTPCGKAAEPLLASDRAGCAPDGCGAAEEGALSGSAEDASAAANTATAAESSSTADAAITNVSTRLPDLVTRAWTLYEAYSATLMGVAYNILDAQAARKSTPVSSAAAVSTGGDAGPPPAGSTALTEGTPPGGSTPSAGVAASTAPVLSATAREAASTTTTIALGNPARVVSSSTAAAATGAALSSGAPAQTEPSKETSASNEPSVVADLHNLDVSHLAKIDLRSAVAGNPVDFIMIGVDIRRTIGFDEVNERVRHALADARVRFHATLAHALARQARRQCFGYCVSALCVSLAALWVGFLFDVSSLGFRGVGGSFPPTGIVWLAIIPVAIFCLPAVQWLTRGSRDDCYKTRARIKANRMLMSSWRAAALGSAGLAVAAGRGDPGVAPVDEGSTPSVHSSSTGSTSSAGSASSNNGAGTGMPTAAGSGQVTMPRNASARQRGADDRGTGLDHDVPAHGFSKQDGSLSAQPLLPPDSDGADSNAVRSARARKTSIARRSILTSSAPTDALSRTTSIRQQASDAPTFGSVDIGSSSTVLQQQNPLRRGDVSTAVAAGAPTPPRGLRSAAAPLPLPAAASVANPFYGRGQLDALPAAAALELAPASFSAILSLNPLPSAAAFSSDGSAVAAVTALVPPLGSANPLKSVHSELDSAVHSTVVNSQCSDVAQAAAALVTTNPMRVASVRAEAGFGSSLLAFADDETPPDNPVLAAARASSDEFTKAHAATEA